MDLFDARYTEREIGDELDRCYTPDKLAQRCLGRLLSQAGSLARKGAWVEPSVGGGAFGRCMSAHEALDGPLYGVDIDPLADGLHAVSVPIVGDWAEVAGQILDPVSLICGNVPFSQSKEHVTAALERHPGAALGVIMPLAYLGVKEWQPIFRTHRLSSLHPIMGRPWPKRMRETAFYVWLPGHVGNWQGMAPVEWR